MSGIADRPGRYRSGRGVGAGALLWVLLAGLSGPARAAVAEHVGAGPATGPVAAPAPASPDVRRLEAWVVARHDARGAPFLIVDKVGAMVFAFDPGGGRVGEAAALLGLTRGDDIAVGTDDLKLAAILPGQRVTPAGRFVAGLGEDLAGKHMLWIDYPAGIAMHAVVTSNPAEHRLQRLATPSVADNRISYGCINVPADFFATVVQPLFAGAGGIVYVLPETRTADAQFFRAGTAPEPASRPAP